MNLEGIKQWNAQLFVSVFWTYVSTETEKELLTEELKSSREAVKQFSQEMNELRGRSEREICTSFFKRVFWLIYEVK